MIEKNSLIFCEKQKFSRLVRWLFILGPVVYVLILLSIVGKEWTQPLQTIVAVVGLTITILATVLLWISKLETQVRSDGLYVRFFPFHINFKKFAFEYISEYYAREYSPILEYGGWGIRFGMFGAGKAYNARGNKGVQLVLKNSKKLLIGSQKPQELVAAIDSIVKGNAINMGNQLSADFERISIMGKTKLVVVGGILSSIVVVIAVLVLSHKTLPPVVYIVLGIFIVFDLLIAFVFLRAPVNRGPISLSPVSHSDSISYSDNLISIDNEGIKIHLYYFPFGAKRINFSDIEVVHVFKGGCLRLWGGDFRTWFGLDWGRMVRQMTFIIKQKNKWSRIGFTCEDSERVANILRSKTILEVQ